MMWNNDWNSWGWGAWCLMFGTMIVIIGLAIWLAATLMRRDNTSGDNRSPEDILAERFARGELGEDDYRRQRDLIRSGPASGLPEGHAGATGRPAPR